MHYNLYFKKLHVFLTNWSTRKLVYSRCGKKMGKSKHFLMRPSEFVLYELNTPMDAPCGIEWNRARRYNSVALRKGLCRAKTWDPLFKRGTVKPIFHGIVLTSWATAAATTASAIVQNPNSHAMYVYREYVYYSECNMYRRTGPRGVSRSTGSPAAVSR